MSSLTGTLIIGALLVFQSPEAIDGDTFRSPPLAIRLWGIDAPEARTAEGKAAKAFLQYLIQGRVECTPISVDRWGRIVARCLVGGLDIGKVMVWAGLARDCPRWSKGVYRSFETNRRLPRRPSCEEDRK